MQTSAMHPATTTSARDRQLRSFVIAWLGITLMMGALAFTGIYYATGRDSSDGSGMSVSAVPSIDTNRAEAAAPDQVAFDPNTIDATQVPVAETRQLNAPAVEAESPAPQQDGSPNNSTVLAAPANPDRGGSAAQDATPVPTPTLPPVQETGFQLGVQVQANPDPAIYSIWMGEVRDKLKLKWIKQQVRWEDVEPAPGQYEWGALDVTFAQAAEYGVNVMVSVVTAPDWAREQGARLDEVGPPANSQTYANFIATMMYRYPGQIHAVEVWNEMNLDREWASVNGLSAQNYVTLLQTTYNTIKMVDP
ncbi:MAG: beta-galactosidase, partial [Anaerolineae bacterium]|nr:beta-galactosidase [Anaerolineae bacterium]